MTSNSCPGRIDMTAKLPTVIRKKCGTYAGYKAHLYYHEEICQPCYDTHVFLGKEYYRENRVRLLEQKALYHLINKEARSAYMKEYGLTVKEHRAAYNKEYQSTNRDKINAQKAAHRQVNPEPSRRSRSKRRALKLGNGHEPYTEAEILDLYGTNCHLCGEPIDLAAPRKTGVPGWERGLHMDHVLALTNGGPDTRGNVKPSHGRCNIDKHDKVLETTESPLEGVS